MTNALKEEARAHCDEARRQEWRDKVMYLTREQAAADEPCRGCGLPVIDSLGSWPGKMYLTDEQRVIHDADQERYRQMHPDCDARRWSMAGSRATHCGYCCPPIPISREQAESIQCILGTVSERPEEELDIWARSLTCGHLVEQSVHHTNPKPSFSTQWCQEHEITRGVVSSEKVVEAAARTTEANCRRDDKTARAEREVKKAEKEAADARKKLVEVQAER